MEETFEKRLKEALEGTPPTTPSRCTPTATPTHSPSFSSLGRRSTSHTTPLSSTRRGGAYYDRCIPSRVSSPRRCLFGSPHTPLTDYKKEQSTEPPKVENLTYHCALQNELLKGNVTEVPDPHTVSRGSPLSVISPSKSNVFKYQSSPRKLDPMAPYSISPISRSSTQLLLSPRRVTRKIPKAPFKVLDAPELQDDFYLNLLDWSSLNLLAVGLGSAVYLWNACTCQVSRLCDLIEENDTLTSVNWSERSQTLALGTQAGHVQIWDTYSEKKLYDLHGHHGRVGSIAWNNDIITSGSRDNTILQWDYRCRPVPTRKLVGHTQEVCGLKWSPDHQYLASGGNDNKLLVWNLQSSSPVKTYTEHTAAIKAIAWSPHQHGVLASGGGTQDRTIRFWNTLTGQPLQWIDTGSQVCNLAWSRSTNEVVSTHGYSQNQIILWRYPSLTQVARLTGHTTRVLYLAMSPDGQTIVTGAGDETLRFWNVFYKSRSHKEPDSPLDMSTFIR